jgi:glyoxylase I family protein
MKIHHACIQTSSYAESLRFYTHILGFEIVEETKNFHGRAFNTWLKQDGFYLELQTAKASNSLDPFSTNNEGLVHLCFSVENIQNCLESIQQMGYDNFRKKDSQIIYSVLGCKLFKVVAPEGTIIEFRDSLSM